jgi:hypothetical protein
MAAVLTQSNSFQLTGRIGRRPTDGELYMAHFMGVGGAAKLINAAEDSPSASAARLFPSAAAANRSIFYDREGRARSVSDVYSVLSARYAGAANSPVTQKALAMFGTGPSSQVMASAATPAGAIDSAAYLSTFPDVRSSAPLSNASASDTGSAAPSGNDPMFRSLFQVDDRSQPVSSRIRELWGSSNSLTSDAASSNGASRPLDLFSDRNGTFSG